MIKFFLGANAGECEVGGDFQKGLAALKSLPCKKEYDKGFKAWHLWQEPNAETSLTSIVAAGLANAGVPFVMNLMGEKISGDMESGEYVIRHLNRDTGEEQVFRSTGG